MSNLNNITKLGKDCCGCFSCEQICPKNCITLKPDNEGFFYPVVDESSCIDCGICVKKCPILTDVKRQNTKTIYAAKIKDEEALFHSTSGGAFYELAKLILEKKGVVFGCAYDENLVARHIYIDKIEDIRKLQNSKYVQSNLDGIFAKVKHFLDSNTPVLFCGTGCQVAGLKAFLGKAYENLYTADIVCHGVPSPKLFEKYLSFIEKKTGEKVTYFNFRSKKGHGWQHYFQYDTKSKSKVTYGMFDPYYNAFIGSKTIRESCYNCKFANTTRPSDITLGDYWGIENAHPEFYSSKGVSLILVNSDKGTKMWQDISDTLTCIESKLEKATPLNSNLLHPPQRPDCRDNIYKGIDGDFDKFVKTNLKFKVNPLKRVIMLFPSDLKFKIKRLIKH